jgi:acetylglutamate kinase
MVDVLKLGGELLEDAATIRQSAHAIVRAASSGPLVIVHGGGRAIDAELRARGAEPKFVDGLRVTDGAALDAVVGVLAGRNNTALVAAIGAAGGRAVGLTGADAFIGRSTRAGTFRAVSGEQVDLGLVGQPDAIDVSLLKDLTTLGYIPVVASIGVTADGELLNVNADTLAGHFSAALEASRLTIAGATAGVLDADGNTIALLTADDMDTMIASGTAHSGMVAKLTACRRALDGGVAEIAIVSGRGVADFADAPGTRLRQGSGGQPRVARSSNVGRGWRPPGKQT